MAVLNVATPYYEPGQDLSCKASAAVVGKRFLKITGNQDADGQVPVAHADAGGRAAGVSDRDAAIGKGLGIMKAPGRVVPVTAAAAIAAFEEVEVGANGQATPLVAGVAVGYALTAAAINTDAKIVLY